MVRKFFVELAAVIALLSQGIIYPATAVVSYIDYDTDTVVITNATGYNYAFEGVEDLEVGDVMSLIMYSNGTPWFIPDDQVVSARYAGFVAEDFGMAVTSAQGNATIAPME